MSAMRTADGSAPQRPPTVLVKLRCPKCKREESMRRDETDPPGTDVVEFLCPECNPSGFEQIQYFDKEGRTLTP